MKELKTYIANLKVNNKTILYNYENYIIKAFIRLYEEYIIHKRDQNYNKGKELVIDSYYGTQ